MPCYDDRTNDHNLIKIRLDAATVAGCELWKKLKEIGNISRIDYWKGILSKETLAWVKEHDDLDREREADERKEAKRRAKLKCPACTCLIKAHHGPKIGCEGAGGNCTCILTQEQVENLNYNALL